MLNKEHSYLFPNCGHNKTRARVSKEFITCHCQECNHVKITELELIPLKHLRDIYQAFFATQA